MSAVGLLVDLSSRADRISQLLEHNDCGFPVDAGICDGDTLLERSQTTRRGNLLVALVNVGLDHDTNNASLSLADLVADNLCDLGLVLVVLLGVAYIGN